MLTLSTAHVAGYVSELDRFLFEWGTVPSCLADNFGFHPNTPPGDLKTVCGVNNGIGSVFYSMFIHGGWLHLFGKMLFLWVFW